MTPRVAVFIDYQNVHFSARSRFLPADAPRQRGHVDPDRVVERIAGENAYDLGILFSRDADLVPAL